MPLEQAGAPPNAARRPTDLNAWTGLLPPRAGVTAHGPAPAPASAPVAGNVASSTANSARQAPLAKSHRRGSYDGDQDEVSQQLLISHGHHSPSSISHPTPHGTQIRNGPSIGRGLGALPTQHAPRHSPSRPHGHLTPSLTASLRPNLLAPTSRFQQPAAGSSSAMEIDELANSEEDEESDVLPLVMSDLDPPYGKAAAPSPPRKKSPAQPTQCTHPPSLSIRENSTLRKTNGTSKASSATSGPRPVVTIPISSSTPTAHRPPSATPRQAEPMTVSVTLPALYTQKKHEKTGSSDSVQPISTTESLSKPTTAKSSVVAVGRRSKPVPDVRIKGGRPKGWKPGMSYREVALRNAGIDPNDPSLPPEILLPPRVRKPGRPPGRPRLPGRPKVNPSQPLGYKRPGRPPIQSIDTVQRSIFLAGQACFAPFVCEWAGCRAELQNMTTLHRHVVVVHGQPSSTAKTCQWRRCAHRVPAVQYKDDADTDADGRTFLEHMEYQHLTPLAWYRGDGFANTGHIGPPQPPPAAALLARSRTREETKPTTDEEKSRALNSATPMVIKAVVNTAPEMPLDGISSEDLPRYLLDDKGRQVTPLLRDTVLESSPVFWSEEERGRRLKDLYRQQQQNLNKRPDRSLGRMM